MYGSLNYHRACADDNLLRTDQVAAVLGVSESWVRKHIGYYEWHHCNLRYGGKAVAYFYSIPGVVYVLRDQAAAKHLERSHTKGLPDILARWIVDGELLDGADDGSPLPIPAWLEPHVRSRQAWHEARSARIIEDKRARRARRLRETAER